MAKKSGLGSTLSSIFDDGIDLTDGSSEQREGIVTLKIGEIEPNKDQPRKEFDAEQLNQLAQSISKHGVIQPLTVREKNGAYQIVAGERRWRAAKIAGLSEVPVRIMELTDSETAQIALIENLQREDLNPIEEANGYKQLTEKYGLKQEEIAQGVGKARSSITNALRLLELPEEVKEMAKQGKLSQGHCKAVLSVQDELKQLALAHKIVAEGLTVRQAENLAKAANGKASKSKQPKPIPQFYKEAEISLKELLGQTVKITPKRNKITLEISCKTEEELREILKVIGNEQ
ncbi:MAG: ParB/RepB/Spo0J family partition protein [Ruminococcaceae bacterium]|nr:ParB/RepB/Spo0J family partition protein [Oscillospiraceae bacterium]